MKEAVKVVLNIDELILGHMRVEKLSDDKFGGKHPNGVNSGYVSEGAVLVFEVGYGLYMQGLRTSPITEINEEEGTFKTANSTYKFEWLKKF